MLLTGALRAFAGASAAWRQATVAAAATAAASHARGSCEGQMPLMVSMASAGLPALTSPPSSQSPWQILRFSSSLAVGATEGGATAPLLRDADDEALSPHPPTTGTSPLTVRYPFAIDYYKDTEAVVFSLDEQPLGLVRLPGAAFNVPVRLDILHRVARFCRAKQQQGTHKAKRRGEVSGGGIKPWAQKKTGRARAGSIRSPLWKGGGATFGPFPRSHAHGLPRSTRLLGMRCALSAKINEGRFFVVDDFLKLGGSDSGPAGRTVRDYRELKDRLGQLTAGSFGSTWLLVDSGEEGRDGGARLRKLLKCSVVMRVLPPEQLTVYSVLRYHRIVVTRSALEALSAALTAPHRVVKPMKHAWWARRREQLDAAVRELNEAAERS